MSLFTQRQVPGWWWFTFFCDCAPMSLASQNNRGVPILLGDDRGFPDTFLSFVLYESQEKRILPSNMQIVIKTLFLAAVVAHLATGSKIAIKSHGADACSGQLSQTCTVDPMCEWCPIGEGGGTCVPAGTTCNCTELMANTCIGYSYCEWCPNGYQGGSCAAAGTKCPCTPMMEHACISHPYCSWCPNGAQGGSCQDASSQCDCSPMTQNSCVGYSYCLWCPNGAMGGTCNAAGTTCNCGVMTMDSCVAQTGVCSWCPTAANMAGLCQPLGTTC